jgi:hypothetical protein
VSLQTAAAAREITLEIPDSPSAVVSGVLHATVCRAPQPRALVPGLRARPLSALFRFGDRFARETVAECELAKSLPASYMNLCFVGMLRSTELALQVTVTVTEWRCAELALQGAARGGYVTRSPLQRAARADR